MPIKGGSFPLERESTFQVEPLHFSLSPKQEPAFREALTVE